MVQDTLTDAVFRLGQVGHAGVSNGELLHGVVRIGRAASGADIFGVGVFENGVDKPSAATSIVGPWTEDQSETFQRQSMWTAQDRILAARLAAAPKNILYRRRELVDESEFKRSKLFLEFQRPLHIGDQCLGAFQREDGLELLIAVGVTDQRGEMPDVIIDKARLIVPYVVRAWSIAWRREPEWMSRLRPATRQVLDLMLAGYDDTQIAAHTTLSYHSVRAHLKRLFREAGVRSRLHLMQVCRGEHVPESESEPEEHALVK